MEQVYDGDGCIYNSFGTISLSPRLTGIMKFILYQMDMHSSSFNRYLNMKVENLLFANIIRNIMENNLSNNFEMLLRTLSVLMRILFLRTRMFMISMNQPMKVLLRMLILVMCLSLVRILS